MHNMFQFNYKEPSSDKIRVPVFKPKHAAHYGYTIM